LDAKTWFRQSERIEIVSKRKIEVCHLLELNIHLQQKGIKDMAKEKMTSAEIMKALRLWARSHSYISDPSQLMNDAADRLDELVTKVDIYKVSMEKIENVFREDLAKIHKKFCPKKYFDNGRKVHNLENLSSEVIEAMHGGEIFTHVNRDGLLIGILLMDSYDKIRVLE